MKVQKTRKYYRKENHNKKLFQERKNKFLDNIVNEKDDDTSIQTKELVQPILHTIDERKESVSPKIITPNIGSVVNHVDIEMIHLLQDPQKLKEFKEFQEFLRMKETSKLNNVNNIPSLLETSSNVIQEKNPQIENQKENEIEENEMCTIEEEIEENEYEEEIYKEEY